MTDFEDLTEWLKTVINSYDSDKARDGKEMFSAGAIYQRANESNSTLSKRITEPKDVHHFTTASPAYKNILMFVDLLCETVRGTSYKTFNQSNNQGHEVFERCTEFFNLLARHCDEIDLDKARGAGTLRFGHVAFRDWYDVMLAESDTFTKTLIDTKHDQYRQELLSYLCESFGNKMRIDYGTGHELNFVIFLIGLSSLTEIEGGDNEDMYITQAKLRNYVVTYRWSILKLFTDSYLSLCRRVQRKFRLEPAGSRGVYNMDDYQFLPFLLGAAQLVGVKHVSLKNFYLPDQVELYKNDYMFFEAVDFILNNKRGPFNEHSYTLWGFTNLNNWDNVFRRIRVKFIEDVLAPFPIVQHIMFGDYILRWNSKD